jgi:dTDP-4-dehydrorhamnose 3,5-epimerase
MSTVTTSGPSVRGTSIPGVLAVDLEVHGDGRGWFKESYQREKLEAAGLPRLEVVQNNVSYNAEVGVTRGIHAEPWDKYISPASGRVFTAIVDLREGEGFGRLETFELTPEQALYVPRGCGNSFCTLEPHTVYNYLVNAHWSPESTYTLVNLFDPTLAVPWPFPREQLIISAKDAGHPMLDQVSPVRTGDE